MTKPLSPGDLVRFCVNGVEGRVVAEWPLHQRQRWVSYGEFKDVL